MKESKKEVSDYYNSVANEYHEQYDREKLHDIKTDYPANYFRLQIMLNSFICENINKVIDVGAGDGTPLITLAKSGIKITGFDLSHEMVKVSKENLSHNGLNPDDIFWGDIQDPITYIHALREGQYDGLIAMGVMPHIENDDLVLNNISKIVKPGGKVFIEFRNKLFSLFTFNKHTKEFILNDLLCNVKDDLKEIISKDLENRLYKETNQTEKITSPESITYNDISAKFHNPFETVDTFKKHNFKNIKLHWYHYHPAMPYLENKDPDIFREEALRLEHESSSWRGYFLASAFVIEATNGE